MAHIVFIVEDDTDIGEALCRVLGDTGHSTWLTTDGRQALAQLRRPGSEAPCLILLDLMMPVMDGLQFLAELKVRRPSGRDTRSRHDGGPNDGRAGVGARAQQAPENAASAEGIGPELFMLRSRFGWNLSGLESAPASAPAVS